MFTQLEDAANEPVLAVLDTKRHNFKLRTLRIDILFYILMEINLSIYMSTIRMYEITFRMIVFPAR
ncbi:Uncharacterised protein [Yersinia enterocolitica]|nr:Uncharacterised protein [Yersinia enterocolitica]